LVKKRSEGECESDSGYGSGTLQDSSSGTSSGSTGSSLDESGWLKAKVNHPRNFATLDKFANILSFFRSCRIGSRWLGLRRRPRRPSPLLFPVSSLRLLPTTSSERTMRAYAPNSGCPNMTTRPTRPYSRAPTPSPIPPTPPSTHDGYPF
jgi:hypothetical protein